MSQVRGNDMKKIDNGDLPEWGDHTLGVEKVPVDHYVAPEFLEFEKREIFGKSWLMTGRASDLPAPGDYLVFPIEAMNLSILIVNGRDNRLRAFHNVCSHRGSPLVNNSCGRVAGVFVCPFHGWAYNLDGRLRGVPERDTFGSLNVEREGLKSVAVDVWGGFIWINLDPNVTVSLAEYLASLGPAFDRYLANPAWSWSYGWRASVKANWKLLVDAQMEGYHVSQLHQKTIAGNVPSQNCRPFLYPEGAGVVSGFHVYRPEAPGVQTPISVLAAQYGSTSMYTESHKQIDVEGGETILNAHPRWIFDDYHIFPNVVMFVQRGQVFTQRTYPISADESVWEVDFYHAERSSTFGQLFNSEQGRIQVRDVLSEDLCMTERLQKTYKSGVIKDMHLNRMEIPMRAFYQAIKRIERAASAEQVQA
jgi:phenylpropionate dioxygenase-like ring-hydroxylating dioxygenase large terminal subunit